MWSVIIGNGTARFVAALSQLVVLVLTARLLGAENRGVLVVAIVWSGLFAALAGLSLGQVSHWEIQRLARRDWLAELTGTMLAVGFCSSVVAYLGFLLLAWPFQVDAFRDIPLRVILAAGLLIPLGVLDEYFRHLLAASDQTRPYIASQVIGGLVRVIVVYLAAGPLELGVGGVVVGLVLAQALVVCVEIRAAWAATDGRLRVSLDRAKALLRGAAQLHPNTVSSFLLVHANVLLLTQLASKSAVAWFQLALQVASTVLLVPQAAAMRFFGLIAQNGPDVAWPAQRRLIVQVMWVVLALSAVMTLAAPLLVLIVAGQQFAPATELLQWLLPAMIGLSLAELMAPQWYGRGVFLLSTVLTVIVAAGNLLLNYFLIIRYGVEGAAWGTTIAYVAIVVTSQFAFACWCDWRSRKTAKAELV